MTKQCMVRVLGLALVLIGAAGASAQTPSFYNGSVGISGTGSDNLFYLNYWSIYGSNLSTGSGTNLYTVVSAEYYTPIQGCDCLGPDCCGTLTTLGPYWYTFNSGTNNTGWFESSGQLNFYALWPSSWNISGTISSWYNVYGGMTVCNSLGNCTPSVNFNSGVGYNYGPDHWYAPSGYGQ